MTPGQLRRTGDPIARLAPRTWVNTPSIYGPLATAEEWAAAELGGTSAARITFWLKLWNALAFGATALALDRLLRSDPARRARAHLLWSVNPLLLWAMIAGGHIDGVATALGFCGLIVLRVGRPGEAVSGIRAFIAGLLAGAATACKVPVGLFGLGVVWASRRSRLALAGAVAGLLVALVPGYAIAGWPAVRASGLPGARNPPRRRHLARLAVPVRIVALAVTADSSGPPRTERDTPGDSANMGYGAGRHDNAGGRAQCAGHRHRVLEQVRRAPRFVQAAAALGLDGARRPGRSVRRSNWVWVSYDFDFPRAIRLTERGPGTPRRLLRSGSPGH